MSTQVTSSTDAPAFAAARDICRRHARSFYFASFFLPRQKRSAAYAVYAFCRLLDDAVDEVDPADQSLVAERLAAFERTLDDVYAGKPAAALPSQEATLATRAFQITVQNYGIEKSLFLALAEGCRMDLTITRYATWADLENYCYHVAGVVGLIMCPIFGLADPAAKTQAVAMGNAMQLTNILRDIREDHERGRIYIPQEDLARFRYSESDVANKVVDDRFRALMRFEIARARELYTFGAAGLQHLANDGSRLTASAMAVIYGGILGAIERQKYDVYTSRAHLTLWQKLARIPAAWRLAKRGSTDHVF